MKIITRAINILLFFVFFSVLTAQKPKIVGLMQIRNEENFLEQHLRALAYYTDAMVIIDDASTDSSPDILKSLAEECHVERIITHINSSRDGGFESDNSQLLLDAGRAVGGTHFIVIDADEMFTANCLEDNFLRKKIFALNPGDSIELCWIQLWRSVDRYRFDNSIWTNNYGAFIFCDNKEAFYDKRWLHATRIPSNLNGKKYRIEGYQYGLLHFQFVNWKNLLKKQAWYRCLEHVRNPKKSTKEINRLYGASTAETDLKTKQAPKDWFNYQFFDPSVYELEQTWRKKQVRDWFEQYGKEFFKDLDIWDVDWECDE